ncbi:hypothetical protein ACHAW6_007656 [Cyclotella cf. meneghiniana]
MRDLPMITEGLHDLVQSYVGEYNISITNPDLYQKASRLQVIATNFEVANVTWFHQEHVLAFLKRIVEEEPFGVFRKRWGDAPIRTYTLALFADKAEVVWGGKPDGYEHGEMSCDIN